MALIEGFFVVVVALFSLVAAITDFRTRRIPNWLTAPALLAALTIHTVSRGPAGLGFSLLGFAAGFGVLFGLWLIGSGGGGDVKLMAALGAWLGAVLTLQVFLVSAIVVAAVAILVLIHVLLDQAMAGLRQHLTVGQDRGTRERDETMAIEGGDKRGWRFPVPYAVPAAVGTWIVLALAWSTGTLPL